MRVAVAPVKPDHLDVLEQPTVGGDVHHGGQKNRVVAVGPLGRLVDGDPDPIAEDRPLPSELAPILPGSFAPTRRHIGEVEADDLVVDRKRLVDQRIEHPGPVHSSRRVRTVVSETFFPQSRSASSQERRMARRTSITSTQSRCGT